MPPDKSSNEGVARAPLNWILCKWHKCGSTHFVIIIRGATTACTLPGRSGNVLLKDVYGRMQHELSEHIFYVDSHRPATATSCRVLRLFLT
ncbi:hypothetical protein PsYK624_137490 [Phanerochaete sordida]|uniref:Uncharacterized protein n=1 Tax=Phanerochaete sordida TaxID=48140 RepID=A0A9P3LJM8_9APHY|nr:hypothetical protein PsYK624_137490 [Phanerochaete sordida]